MDIRDYFVTDEYYKVFFVQLFCLCFQQKFESEVQEVAGSQFSVSQQETTTRTGIFENASDIKVH